MYNKYPYTNFHEVNLDYIIKLVRENAGLHLTVEGDKLQLKTLDGNTVSNVTIPYATEAGHSATATNATNANVATTALNANQATNAVHALTADEATEAVHASTASTASTATTATTATNATNANHALTATNATHAGTADYAMTTEAVEHADKAIETVTISGDNILFTSYDGTTTTITVPYSVKANKDSRGNIISTTYIADVVDDEGTLKFKDAEGNTVVSLVPSSVSASEDNYGNSIADYIKSVVSNADSNYVAITHGDGTADSITINYATTAWKDTNGHVIKNYYISSLEMVEDPDDGKLYLIGYNGDTPRAELFRTELISQVANKDSKGRDISSITSSYLIKTMGLPDDPYNGVIVVGCFDNDGHEIDFEDIPESSPLMLSWQPYHTEGNPPATYLPINYVNRSSSACVLNTYSITISDEPIEDNKYSLQYTSYNVVYVYVTGSFQTGSRVALFKTIELGPEIIETGM